MGYNSHLAIEWFASNKCHLLVVLVSGYKHENIWERIGEVKTCESSKQKLLGIVIDRDLSFNEYVSSLRKKVGRKLFIKIMKSNPSSTKKAFNEIVRRSPVWLLSIILNVSW